MVVRNPLPFAAALWARTVEISAISTFFAIALTTSSLFDEIVNRAEDLITDSSLYGAGNSEKSTV